MFETTLWNWASPVWLVAAVGAAIYGYAVRPVSGKRMLLFASSMAILVLAFVSPLGVLADGYLFSAHMVQHLLLLLVVPLLVLTSLPKNLCKIGLVQGNLLSAPSASALPVLAWICGVGAMWFWHVPSFCSAATQNPLLGGVRDVSLIAAGLLFWWPIYAPLERFRLEPLTGIVYLFSACLGCTLLGIYITFTTISVCPAFASPASRIGIVNQLYDFGLTPSVDQQLGGLLMWVPPCTIYVGAILGLLSRWYSTIDDQPQFVPTRTIHLGERA